jgi:hypothetical protein
MRRTLLMANVLINLAMASNTCVAKMLSCEDLTSAGLRGSMNAGGDLRASLLSYLTKQFAKPRYFEGLNPTNSCTPFRTNLALYPGIPARDCTYTELGLKGWVRLALITPELATRWIMHSCSAFSQLEMECVVRVTTNAWCSNQLSFPIVGNLIEPANSAGGKGSSGVNLVFLHGVTVTRPGWMGERESVDPTIQRNRLGPWAASTKVLHTGEAAQVSRPAAVRREIYLKYTANFGKNGLPIDVGRSCPITARKVGWLEVSREAFVEGWQQGRNRLFDAAAQALMRSKFPGRIKCE